MTIYIAAGLIAGLLCALLVFLPLPYLIYRMDRAAMIQVSLIVSSEYFIDI